MIPSAMTAEEVGRIGYDYVCVDMQHGQIGYQMAVDMIRAINLGSSAPFVRVPWNSHADISKMLDAGALGVIVPVVNSPAETAQAVESCRFPPQGLRSHAITRAAQQHGSIATPAEMNQAVLCIPMVETTQAIENVAAIAQVKGVDAVYVGPNDLSISLGLPPGNNDGSPEFDQALAKVLAVCQETDSVAGIHANPSLAEQRIQQGFGLVTVATDSSQLHSSMAASLERARRAP